MILLVALGAGGLTHSLGLEAVFGAFIAGIVLGRSRFHDADVFPHLDGLTRSFFAPLFFATAGLRVDLGLLRDPEVLQWGLVVVLVASASKAGGAYLGSRFAGLPQREGLALGVGLNARGAIEIVVATVGLSLGVLNPRSYALVVLMAMVTSMMAPPLLRAVLRNWHGDEEEQARLERERQLGGNVLVRASRVLLPSHGGPNSVLAARLVDLAWPEGSEVTVLAAGRDVPPEDLAKVRAALGRPPHQRAKRAGPGAAARDPRSRGARLRRGGGRRDGRAHRGHLDLARGGRPARFEPAAGGDGAPRLATRPGDAASLPPHPRARRGDEARARGPGDRLRRRPAPRRPRAARPRGHDSLASRRPSATATTASAPRAQTSPSACWRRPVRSPTRWEFASSR